MDLKNTFSRHYMGYIMEIIFINKNKNKLYNNI